MLAHAIILHVVTMKCLHALYRYRVESDWETFNHGTAAFVRTTRCKTSCIFARTLASSYFTLILAIDANQSESTKAPYMLLANFRYIHQLSLDGSRLRTIISEPNQYIYTLDYHIRYFFY